MAAEKDEIVLSFYDSLLKKSDVELLNEGHWLNDRMIGFVFEYLEREQFKDMSDKVLFVSPDVTQFIKLGQGPELGIFLEPLNLSSRQMVFFAVNDNESRMSTGGMHWSLLVYSRTKNRFYHYDSMDSHNAEAAKQLCESVQFFLNAKETPVFTEPDCPQQKNCSDCGVYVVCITEQLCRQYYRGEQQLLKELVTQASVSRKRRSIKSLIHSLREKQQGPT